MHMLSYLSVCFTLLFLEESPSVCDWKQKTQKKKIPSQLFFHRLSFLVFNFQPTICSVTDNVLKKNVSGLAESLMSLMFLVLLRLKNMFPKRMASRRLLMMHKSPNSLFQWLTLSPLSLSLYELLTATWLDMLQVITVVSYIRTPLCHNPASPASGYTSNFPPHIVIEAGKLLGHKTYTKTRQRGVHSSCNVGAKKKLRCAKMKELEGEMKEIQRNGVLVLIQWKRACNTRRHDRKRLQAKLKWKSSVSTCVVSCKSRSISLLFLSLVVGQDEAADGCCCRSGCGQLCQSISGRPGVPLLETQVWWVSLVTQVSFVVVC